MGRKKWSEYRTEPNPQRRRMTLRLTDAEWEDIAAIQGDRSLSKAIREVVAAGLDAMADRKGTAEP
jgi:hypothetical protein